MTLVRGIKYVSMGRGAPISALLAGLRASGQFGALARAVEMTEQLNVPRSSVTNIVLIPNEPLSDTAADYIIDSIRSAVIVDGGALPPWIKWVGLASVAGLVALFVIGLFK